MIIAHPKSLHKDKNEGYPCPDVYDIADGAMWNNKCDNILVYHRPDAHKDPQSPVCELHAKKIRRQKVVGKKGTLVFNYDYRVRRFVFNDMPLNKKHLTESKELTEYIASIKSAQTFLHDIKKQQSNIPDYDTQIQSKGKEEDFLNEF
jgi:hypothetical protein